MKSSGGGGRGAGVVAEAFGTPRLGNQKKDKHLPQSGRIMKKPCVRVEEGARQVDAAIAAARARLRSLRAVVTAVAAVYFFHMCFFLIIFSIYIFYWGDVVRIRRG